MTPRPRTWGLRFSAMDALMLVLGFVAARGLWGVSPEIALLPLVALGHFFLFCNVFRVRREPELIWTAALILNAAAWEFLAPGAESGGLRWGMILGAQTPLTLLLLAIEIRHPRYHGIFARRINPRLDDYLRGDIP